MRALTQRELSAGIATVLDFNTLRDYEGALPPDFINPNPGEFEAKVVPFQGRYYLGIRNLKNGPSSRCWPLYWAGMRLKVDLANPFKVILHTRDSVPSSDVRTVGPALHGLDEWIYAGYRFTENPPTDQLWLVWGSGANWDARSTQRALTGALQIYSNGPGMMKTSLFQKEHSGIPWYVAKTHNPEVAAPETVIPTKGPDIEKQVGSIPPIPFATVGIMYENGTVVGKQTLVAKIEVEGTIPLISRSRADRVLTGTEREKVN